MKVLGVAKNGKLFCRKHKKIAYSKREIKDEAKRTGLRYYKCEQCRHWHLTSLNGLIERKEECDEFV